MTFRAISWLPKLPSSEWRVAGRLAASAAVLATLALPGCKMKIPDYMLATPAPEPTKKPVADESSAPIDFEPSTSLGPPESGSRSPLRNYYLHKYTAEQLASTRAAVDLVLPNYSKSDASQARAEILAFHWVIYHETDNHHIVMNHSTIRPYESLLKKLCHDFDVPMPPVLAITSWENSGSGNKVSWADAAGLGQMTWGAIEQAHNSAGLLAQDLRAQAKQHPDQAQQLNAQADLLNLAVRHRKLTKTHHLKDERFSPEANLEDVVMFFKFLLSQYGNSIDLAIVAYHQGVGNTDDVLADYLGRKDPSAPLPATDRKGFIEALKRWNVTYVSLWNDQRSRQMLNGLRTMTGVVTTAENRGDALGDESDIYLWKVLGSLAGFERGTAFVADMVERDRAPQSEVEVSGLPIYDSARSLHQAWEANRLMPTHMRLIGQKGQKPLQGLFAGLDKLDTPELEGYLLNLRQRLRQATGDAQARLPIRTLVDARALEAGSKKLFTKVQLRGVTAVLVPSRLPDEQQRALLKLLNEDYTMDRIYYKVLSDHANLICLNPRYGDDDLALLKIQEGSAGDESAGETRAESSSGRAQL